MEITNLEKLLFKIIPIFEKLGIKYFITGGFAVSVWGKPRATFDIDIVVELIEPKISFLAKALRKISQAGYIDEETAKEAIKNKKEFNFIDPETGLKIDFWIMKDDKRAKIEYSRRIVKKINGQRIYFISPEDLILNKLLWHKETQSSRHLEDVESILKFSKVDLNYLKKWAVYLNVSETLKEVLKK